MTTGGILLVGGGTGGHVFPMIAVADAVRELHPELPLVFVGTQTGIEARVVPARGYPLELIDALPIRGGGTMGALRGAARAFGGLRQARALLARHQPSVVFSLGGYVAGAVSLAARASRVPLALMEPNSVPGLANRWIAPFVQRAYVAFDETVRHFPRKSVLRSGVAIRSGFEPRPYAPNPGLLRVLVLGGSQGARALNLAIPRAAGACTNALQIVHQVGRGNTEPVIAAYAQHAPQRQARVVEFIEEMPQALADADLVISRSGASAVSEICAVGRPSILVPYPFAAGDHQKGNALALAGIDAALCVEEVAQDAQGEATAEKIAQALNELTGDAHRLEAMARAARAWGRPQAARQVARDLLQLGGLSVQEPAGGTAPDGKIDGLLRVGVAAAPPAVSQGRA